MAIDDSPTKRFGPCVEAANIHHNPTPGPGDGTSWLIGLGATVVTRLRRDAKLFDLPKPRQGQRGRPRKYGVNRISLVKRAAQRRGWKTTTYDARGVMTEARYKSFLATTELAGGAARVVLLEHAPGNWAAYIGTDPNMSVEAILETTSNRWAIKEHFHDVKEVSPRKCWPNAMCFPKVLCLGV